MCGLHQAEAYATTGAAVQIVQLDSFQVVTIEVTVSVDMPFVTLIDLLPAGTSAKSTRLSLLGLFGADV